MNVLEQARTADAEARCLKALYKKMGLDTAEIKEQIDDANKALREAQKLIDSVENRNERTVLRYRYLLGFTWQGIADAMGCDVSTVFRRHDRCLKRMGLK